MERLTHREKYGVFIIDNDFTRANGLVKSAIERLASYEDTGLTPDDIKKMLNKRVWRNIDAEKISIGDKIVGEDGAILNVIQIFETSDDVTTVVLRNGITHSITFKKPMKICILNE